MKKALFISSRELYPLVGGEKIRTAQQLEFLAKEYSVDVICMSENKEYNLGTLKQYISNYYHFCVPKWKNILWTLRFLFNQKPLQVNYYYSTKINKFIQKRINQYDIIFCNNIRTADYILGKKINGIKCIDYVDAISLNYKRTINLSTGFKRRIYNLDAKRCKIYEKIILNDFDLHCIISDIDAKYILSDSNNKNIYIINNAVCVYNQNKCCQQNIDNTIIFVGKMSYDPNIVAVKNFSSNIMPIILQQYPYTKFIIVGSNPTPEIINLSSKYPYVEVTGFVEDINQYIVNSTIVVAPMLNGAGVQNKILQAMALGCCIVTTTIGSEGLNCNNNEICVVDGNNNIATKIIELLGNKQKRIEYGIKTKNHVIKHMSKDVIFKEFKTMLSSVQRVNGRNKVSIRTNAPFKP